MGTEIDTTTQHCSPPLNGVIGDMTNEALVKERCGGNARGTPGTPSWKRIAMPLRPLVSATFDDPFTPIEDRHILVAQTICTLGSAILRKLEAGKIVSFLVERCSQDVQLTPRVAYTDCVVIYDRNGNDVSFLRDTTSMRPKSVKVSRTRLHRPIWPTQAHFE